MRKFLAGLMLLWATSALAQQTLVTEAHAQSQVPISGLPAGTPLAGSELVPLVQGGTTVQLPVNAFWKLNAPASIGAVPIFSQGTSSTPSTFGTPIWSIVNTENLTSFSSASTQFGFVFQANKATGSGSNTTGSRQAFTAQQLGAGGTAADFFTGGFFLAMPTAGSFNNGGNFTGSNPYVSIPMGMTPASTVGEEIDVTTKSAPSAREGLRIADLGSTQSGSGLDAAISVISSGVGFSNGLFFGDNAGLNFPMASGGTLINIIASSVGLSAALDLSAETGTYTKDVIVLNAKGASPDGIRWGSAGAGGSIESLTTTGALQMGFANNFIQFGVIGTPTVFIEPSSIMLSPLTIANLPPCTAGSEGLYAYVKDTLGNAVPTFHLAVAAGGATAVHSPVSCNGTNWQYD
jgi:hypothetical protein